MKKNFRRRTFSEHSLDGEIALEGSRLQLHFRYDPQRVAFVKSLKGARYDPESKMWSIPREQYAEFNKCSLFPEDRYPRNFSEAYLTQTIESLAALRAAALKAYQTDRFAVPFEYLDLLNLDVVICQAQDIPQLRAKVRFASKATAILTRLKGAHFLRSEGRFAVPAESLAQLLSKLRDKQLTFAVESQCGLRLKQSAEKRKNVLARIDQASPDDLEQTFLTPYVDFAQTEDAFGFELRYATSRHLAELFPDDESFHVRKKKSMCLNERELCTLVNRIHALNYPLYLTRAVHSHLSRLGLTYAEGNNSAEAIPEDILPFLKIPKAWVALDSGAGLIMDPAQISEPLRQLLSAFNVQKVGGKNFYSVGESKLLNFYRTIQDAVQATHASGFADLLCELEQRAKEVEKNKTAKQKQDATLSSELLSDSHLASRLFPHQRVAVEWLIEREYSLLGDDMGLGKTLSVLTSIDCLLTAGKIGLSLIICPNSLARNWLREAERFLPKRKFLLVPESPKVRASLMHALLKNQVSLHGLIVNYERMRRPDVLDALKKLTQRHDSLLCFDESQRVKNGRSQTFLALKEIAPQCVRRIALTGTPTPRDVTDIWSQIQILDGGKRFGTHYTKWLKSVAELGTKYSDFAVRKFKPGAVEETIARVHELLLRRKKEEVLSLPEKLFATRDCVLSGTQASRYEEVREQLLLRLSTLSGGSFIKQIDNLLEEYLRAVQIASNPRLVDQNWQGEPSKFLELDEIVEEIVVERGEKIVVWTNFVGNVDELVLRYQSHGARAFCGRVSPQERDATVRDFQGSSEVKILVAIPAAGGVGITLTAAQTAVYVDKSWNAEHWMQSVDRIHRIGQTGTVNIISLSACKIDELISRNLKRKQRAQAGLLGDMMLSADDSNSENVDYPSREELIEALQEVD